MARRPTASDFFHLPPQPTRGDTILSHIRNQLLPLLDEQPESPPPTTSPPPPSPSAGSPTLPSGATSPSLPPRASSPPSSQPDSPLDSSPDLQSFREKWSSTFDVPHSWEVFCQHVATFASEGRELASSLFAGTSNRRPQPRDPNRPSARRPPSGRRPNQFDPKTASRLQNLYRHSKKRAARQILTNESPSYSGSLEDATTFFQEAFTAKHCDLARVQTLLTEHVPSTESAAFLAVPPTEEEICSKLRGCANTSPGPDRIEYRHIKKLDPKCTILAKIFRVCFDAQNVPPQWKTAVTVLIHKKGLSSDISNFRPIALMSCLYKLMMGVIGKRIRTWAIDNNILSAEQKSARPSEGCYEHTFLLQSLIGNARRKQRNAYLAWLDLRNAFGSLPHGVLRSTMAHIGVPDHLSGLIMNAYTNSSTTIRTSAGDTAPIPTDAGVKQGCPLSPILFNLSIELILRMVKATASTLKTGLGKHYNTTLSVLAYADDLVLIARSKSSLQALLDATSSSASALGLQFRPDKSATLSFTNSKRYPDRIESNAFIVQDQPVPALREEEHYRYLGIPIGLVQNIDNVPSLADDLCRNLNAIDQSNLAPWQKLDAIRSFVQPCLTFALRAGHPQKQSLKAYRSCLVRVLRNICSLPTRSCADYFFAHRRVGGLGLQDPLEEVDIQTVLHALKMLSSPDPTVACIARAELEDTVRFASKSNPTPSLISSYMSSEADDRLTNDRFRAQSLWTRARKAVRRLGLKFHVSSNQPPTITTPDSAPILAHEASRSLHFHVSDQHALRLSSLPDQGKVARTLNIDQYANGSTWQFTGLNLRFHDWRFIHRARLNCLPLNAAKARWSETSPRCRHCSSEETLPHVLCHCRLNMVAIRDRHNLVVNRLVNATRFGDIVTDRCVQDSGLNLRPDIIIREGDHVKIIDVCCPFENNDEALFNAAERKITKYEPLKEFFLGQGLQCDVFPFVIGALGAWFPPNETVLRQLGMTKTYKRLFRKLCCTDVIQGSNNIYRQHLGFAKDADAPALSEQ